MNLSTANTSRPVQAFHSKEHASLGIVRADGTREFVPYSKDRGFGKCGSITIQAITITDPEIHDEENLYPHDCGDTPLPKGTTVYVVSDICYGVPKHANCVCTEKVSRPFELTVQTPETNFHPYATVNLIHLPIDHL